MGFPLMDQLRGVLGMGLLLGVAWAMSEDRKRISWRLVGIGVGLQLALAALLLYLPPCRLAFAYLGHLVTAMVAATQAGTSVVLGYLGGGDPPFDVTRPGSAFILATQSLPLVLLISAISALLFHWRIMQKIVACFSFLLRKTMGVGGAEGVGISANIFVGMVEAPLLVQHYVKNLSRSALFTIMVTGMATIAGTVLGLYATFIGGVLPNAAGHLLTASIISAPAAIVVARMMIPEPLDARTEEVDLPSPYAGSMDAITQGTASGLQLLLNIVAMMIVLIALVHLVDLGLGLFPNVAGKPLALTRIFGWVMAPVTWLLGVPWPDATTAGELMGVKTVLNELIAYNQLGQLGPGAMSLRGTTIMAYAMCGFANPGSVGIMIAGMSTMAPERRSEIAALGFRSLLAGTMATCMTGIVVGWLTWG
jgi:CNT family concentrative nucleoside transporter